MIVDGKTFALRDHLTLAARAWFKRAMLAAEEVRVDIDKAGAFIDFVADDSERINSCMRVAYKGDHAGIDWFLDVDAEVTVKALSDFFLSILARKEQSENESPTS
jgi:hypothetical protein